MAAAEQAPAVQIRLATAEDAEALALLCAEHAVYERIDYDAAGHAGRLAQGLAAGRLQVWLAQSEAGIAGYAAATVDFSTLSARPYLHLDCLYIRAALRSQGIGERLLQAVQAAGARAGCSEMQWQTPVWNSGAIRFYTRLGAATLPKQRFYLALPPL